MGYVLLALFIHMLRPCHADLGDARTIHAQHLKGVVVPYAGLADGRYAPNLGSDEAAERVKVVVILVGQSMTEHISHVVDDDGTLFRIVRIGTHGSHRLLNIERQ